MASFLMALIRLELRWSDVSMVAKPMVALKFLGGIKTK